MDRLLIVFGKSKDMKCGDINGFSWQLIDTESNCLILDEGSFEEMQYAKEEILVEMATENNKSFASK